LRDDSNPDLRYANGQFCCADETADGTLSVENDPGEGKIRSAMTWTKALLAEGPRRANDVYKEAEADGFIASTVWGTDTTDTSMSRVCL
jgi:hypothetical protein